MTGPGATTLLLDDHGPPPDSVWPLDPPRHNSGLAANRRPNSEAAGGGASGGALITLIGTAIVMFLLGVLAGALLYNLVLEPAVALLSNSSDNTTEFGDDGADDFEMRCPDFIWSSSRLPQDIIPLAYNLTVHPNITENRLRGEVTIALDVINETDLIVLHAENLNLTSHYVKVNGKRVRAEFTDCLATSLWAFQLNNTVDSDDEVFIGIEYEGKIGTTELQGLYITTHNSIAGDNMKWQSAVTQFEPAYARRMLPCFDEPIFKAHFTVSIIREAHHVVRSNMGLRVTREYGEGLYLDVFEKSVRMSTYLLAVAVLDNYSFVKRMTTETKKPIEVRLYAPADGIKGHAEYGLDVGVRALEFFERYFNISYPLEKEDLLALDDFSEGAMENWGLITFRDSTLLYSNTSSSLLHKEHIALIVCHEIAHQWFGNLVTMEWWGDLWLNEGFANYMEYKCVDDLFPDWNIMTRFYADNVAHSMEADGLSSSRPISSPFSTNTSNIMSLFDAISYHKAASIIHMIAVQTGEENFQSALVEYLNKYAYGNARGEQLWEIVEKHSTTPHAVSVQELAKAFTTQVGYPMIHVALDAARERIIVSNQTRFFFDADRDNDGDDDAHDDEEHDVEGEVESDWPLPVQYRTDKSDENHLEWIEGKDHRASWSLEKPVKWIVANTGGVGYFKVLYERRIYEELIAQLHNDHKVIDPIDRAMIIADAYDFTKAGKLEIDTYMRLIEYAAQIEDEKERMTWSLINKQLRSIESLIEDSSFLQLFKDFQRSLIVRLYDKLKWTAPEPEESERGLRTEIITMACRLKHGDCVKQATNRFQQWLKERAKSSPDLQPIVLEAGVKYSDENTWNIAFDAMKDAGVVERQHLLSGLAATYEPSLITKLLNECATVQIRPNLSNHIMHETVTHVPRVRPNMVPRVFGFLAQNHYARPIAWRFFMDQYTQFIFVLGEGSNLLLNSIRHLGERVSTQRDYDEMKTFLEGKDFGKNKARLQQMYEQVELNMQWRRLNEVKLGEWLKEWDEKRRAVQRGKRRHAHRQG